MLRNPAALSSPTPPSRPARLAALALFLGAAAGPAAAQAPAQEHDQAQAQAQQQVQAREQQQAQAPVATPEPQPAPAAPPPAATRLDTLRVEAAPLPLPLAHSERLQAEVLAPDPRGLGDLLRPVPGLYLQNADNVAQGLRPSIRGFGARAAFGVRGIRVRLDGLPLTLADGQTELDLVDRYLLAGAEVVRGPAASLYGNAAGGVIALRTRPLDESGGRWQAGLQRHDGYSLRGEWTRAQAWRASLARVAGDGPRAHSHSARTLGQLRVEHGAWRWDLASLQVQAQDPGGLDAPTAAQTPRAARDRNVDFDAGEEIRQQRLGLHWRHSAGLWDWRLRGQALRRDFANRLPFAESGQVDFERDAGSLALLASRSPDARWPGRSSLGLDLQLQHDARRRYDNTSRGEGGGRAGQRGALRLDQDERALAAGLYLRHAQPLGAAWTLTAGLRQDWLRLEARDRFGADGDDSGRRRLNDSSADVALRWAGDDRQGFVRYASAHLTPTISELANPAGGGFNPDLASSRIHGLDLGYGQDWREGHVGLVLFAQRSCDELLPFEREDQPGRRFYRNAGRSERRGVELEASWRPRPAWTLDLAYTLLRARFVDDGGAPDAGASLAGRRLPGLPEQWLAAQLQHRLGLWTWGLELDAQGARFADDANTLRVPGVALWHLRAQREAWLGRPGLRLSLALDNALDQPYTDNLRINAFGGRAFEPGGGRRWRLALEYAWARP